MQTTPDGIEWQVALLVQCAECGTKQFDDAGNFSVFYPAFNRAPMEEDFDDLRTEFVANLELQGWEVRELDYYDAPGKFICPPCVRGEDEPSEVIEQEANGSMSTKNLPRRTLPRIEKDNDIFDELGKDE